MQYDRLNQEMQDIAVAGLIQKRPKMKASRSLPAIGLGARHPPKLRVSTPGPPPPTRCAPLGLTVGDVVSSPASEAWPWGGGECSGNPGVGCGRCM